MPRVSNDDDYVPKADKNSQYKPDMKNPPPRPFTASNFTAMELPQYEGAPKNLSINESRDPGALIDRFIDSEIINLLIQRTNANAAYQRQLNPDPHAGRI
jgi:hypothetical protein